MLLEGNDPTGVLNLVTYLVESSTVYNVYTENLRPMKIDTNVPTYIRELLVLSHAYGGIPVFIHSFHIIF